MHTIYSFPDPINECSVTGPLKFDRSPINSLAKRNASNFLNVNQFSVTKGLKLPMDRILQVLDSMPCNFMSRLIKSAQDGKQREYPNIISLSSLLEKSSTIVDSGAHEALSLLLPFPRTRSPNLKSSGNKKQALFQLLI